MQSAIRLASGTVRGYLWSCGMGSSALNSDSLAPEAAGFALTHWSVVLAAGRNESTHSRNALEQLCRTYWHPVYAFVRRRGFNPHDAQDLTQEFFTRLLEKNYLSAVDPTRGRFRSFLLASVKHFLANEWDKARCHKRGGAQPLLSIDGATAETFYALEPIEHQTPETIYERRWAVTLLERVLARLRSEHCAAHRGDNFDILKRTLTEGRGAVAYAELASQLGSTEGAVKVAVHRLRQRYRVLLRDEIRQTVSNPAEVEDEVRALFIALGG